MLKYPPTTGALPVNAIARDGKRKHRAAPHRQGRPVPFPTMSRPLSLAFALLVLASPSTQAALPGGEALASLILHQFDTNSDGFVDAGEWQSGIARSFDDMDGNGDNKLTGSEIDSLQSEIAKETGELAAGIVVTLIKKVILTLDTDKDQAVSRKEYDANAEGFFKTLDVDKNGTLSKPELADLPVKMITG
jgi:Ca2+-binding EF-hand superfamily protein